VKIAISGKGGVGKSTVAAALALTLARRGEKVLALDADPDANLASALGVSEAEQAKIASISKQIALIEERTGAKVAQYGQVFKINPEVADVAERFAVRRDGVDLLVLGAVQSGGGGCACPESMFLKALVTDLTLYKKETLLMDMEAGVEHLGRATAQGVDYMLLVLEPGKRAVDCAKTARRMAREIGVRRFLLVGNKIQGEADEAFLREAFPDETFAAMLPWAREIRDADRDGVSVMDAAEEILKAPVEAILKAIEG
jgi:CO dehydrogenase maturation factor